MGDDLAAVPGDLLRAVAQEVIGLEVVPEGGDRLLWHLALGQDLPGLALVFTDLEAHVRRVFQPLAQGLWVAK